MTEGFFLQETDFFLWEMFSWNGDFKSISSCMLIVAPMWLVLQQLELSSLWWCSTVPLLLRELAVARAVGQQGWC